MTLDEIVKRLKDLKKWSQQSGNKGKKCVHINSEETQRLGFKRSERLLSQVMMRGDANNQSQLISERIRYSFSGLLYA